DLVAQAGQDRHLAAKRRQRRQDRRELEGAAFGCRCPRSHLDAVRHVDRAEPLRAQRRLQLRRRERRQHAVEPGKRQADAEAAQERPARYMSLGHHAAHSYCDLLVAGVAALAAVLAAAGVSWGRSAARRFWNGALLTIPWISADHRYSPGSAT